MKQRASYGVLRCTSKYRKLVGLPNYLAEPERASTGALGDWYANTLNVGPLRFLHYTSALSRLAVIVHLSPRQTAELRFVSALRDLLLHFGVSALLTDLECLSVATPTYAPAKDRSVLATMRHQGRAVQFDITSGFADAPWDLMLRLAETPMGPLNGGMPEWVAPRLLQNLLQGPRGVG